MSDKVFPPNNYERFTLSEAAFICGHWLSAVQKFKPKGPRKICKAVIDIYRNQQALRKFQDHPREELEAYIDNLQEEYAERIVNAARAQTKIS